ncbi:methionine ABC transporter ATP-binding protein [Vibrio maritimus]|uniref:Methionine ABC transporter ATP-binding protein n=1 Tax=Vibrio maritimus TaxID=990268 RepID=A0A090T738_9VIBR|nr:methionine ABC transporter ATP-binding protein [Vibrio maritimus]
MIRLEDIQVTFNPGTILENRALKGVNLEVPEHQFLTVIGSNGAGKSTLLGAVTGETPMVGGRVLIDDMDVTRQTVDQRANQCARVFQDPLAGTCGDLSIEENMALATCVVKSVAGACRCRVNVASCSKSVSAF